MDVKMRCSTISYEGEERLVRRVEINVTSLLLYTQNIKDRN
jgi:hypothetical protein